MARVSKITAKEIEQALEAVKRAGTPDELRMAQVVLSSGLLKLGDRLAGMLVGRSRATVVRLRKKFLEFCRGNDSQDRNWGGRRYGYMTLDQEIEFLSRFFDQAKHGGMLVVSDIKREFEAAVGRTVAKTTVYRMLERHGWRKIMPRPRHPKSDSQAHEAFKKTPETGQ